MIPGISSDSEKRLLALLDRKVTDVTPATFEDREFALIGGNEQEARDLGIESIGRAEPTIVVTDRTRRLGRIRIEAAGRDATLFFDNRNWGGNCHANIRILGNDTVLFFNEIGDSYVALPDLYLRSDGQFLFWGRLASAVGCNMEIEGVGHGVVIGDDALISGGVWIRNYDMHAMHDLHTGNFITRPPVDTVLERHVWLGQDAMLLSCERIGMGSIVGARSLLKQSLPSCVVAAGTPARVVRTGTSWGRNTYGMTAAERVSIGMPENPEGVVTEVAGTPAR
jgi:acetyltransferase-like isoleucine patch superfamily enzyme